MKYLLSKKVILTKFFKAGSLMFFLLFLTACTSSGIETNLQTGDVSYLFRTENMVPGEKIIRWVNVENTNTVETELDMWVEATSDDSNLLEKVIFGFSGPGIDETFIGVDNFVLTYLMPATSTVKFLLSVELPSNLGGEYNNVSATFDFYAGDKDANEKEKWASDNMIQTEDFVLLAEECGDDILNIDVEECDDGNLVNGDGCSDMCRWELDETKRNVGDIVINEVAWMGNDNSVHDEWIELKNMTNSNIPLVGWTLNSQDGSPMIQLEGVILANDYFLLERIDDASVPEIVADLIFASALSDTGEDMELKDDLGNLIDNIDSASGWLAGDNTEYRTMERDADGNYYDSFIINGTPRTGNSIEPSDVPPQCSDGIDNDEDGLIDENDPGCHSDGDVHRDSSYNPDMNDEDAKFNQHNYIYVLSDNINGGDCLEIGSWDLNTKTCSITSDVIISVNDIEQSGKGGIIIVSDNIILEGSGYSIVNNLPTVYNNTAGIEVFNSDNVEVKNISIENFSFGVKLFESINSFVENINTKANAGVWLYRSDYAEISSSTFFSDRMTAGIYVNESSDNIIHGNIIDLPGIAFDMLTNVRRNNIYENNVLNNEGTAIRFYGTVGNLFYNNNFYTKKLGTWSPYAGSGSYPRYDSFNKDLPIGGNYWADYDSPDEGCEDNDNNGICDNPLLLCTDKYGGRYDNLPYTSPDGWKVINDSPEIFLQGNNPMTLEYGQEYVEPGATVTDDHDSGLEVSIDIPVSINSLVPGEYSVVYSVVDSEGASTEVVRVVEVQKKFNALINLDSIFTDNTAIYSYHPTFYPDELYLYYKTVFEKELAEKDIIDYLDENQLIVSSNGLVIDDFEKEIKNLSFDGAFTTCLLRIKIPFDTQYTEVVVNLGHKFINTKIQGHKFNIEQEENFDYKLSGGIIAGPGAKMEIDIFDNGIKAGAGLGTELDLYGTAGYTSFTTYGENEDDSHLMVGFAREGGHDGEAYFQPMKFEGKLFVAKAGASLAQAGVGWRVARRDVIYPYRYALNQHEEIADLKPVLFALVGDLVEFIIGSDFDHPYARTSYYEGGGSFKADIFSGGIGIGLVNEDNEMVFGVDDSLLDASYNYSFNSVKGGLLNSNKIKSKKLSTMSNVDFLFVNQFDQKSISEVFVGNSVIDGGDKYYLEYTTTAEDYEINKNDRLRTRYYPQDDQILQKLLEDEFIISKDDILNLFKEQGVRFLFYTPEKEINDMVLLKGKLQVAGGLSGSIGFNSERELSIPIGSDIVIDSQIYPVSRMLPEKINNEMSRINTITASTDVLIERSEVLSGVRDIIPSYFGIKYETKTSTPSTSGGAIVYSMETDESFFYVHPGYDVEWDDTLTNFYKGSVNPNAGINQINLKFAGPIIALGVNSQGQLPFLIEFKQYGTNFSNEEYGVYELNNGKWSFLPAEYDISNEVYKLHPKEPGLYALIKHFADNNDFLPKYLQINPTDEYRIISEPVLDPLGNPVKNQEFEFSFIESFSFSEDEFFLKLPPVKELNIVSTDQQGILDFNIEAKDLRGQTFLIAQTKSGYARSVMRILVINEDEPKIDEDFEINVNKVEPEGLASVNNNVILEATSIYLNKILWKVMYNEDLLLSTTGVHLNFTPSHGGEYTIICTAEDNFGYLHTSLFKLPVNDISKDSDSDGISDKLELMFGFDPLIKDSELMTSINDILNPVTTLNKEINKLDDGYNYVAKIILKADDGNGSGIKTSYYRINDEEWRMYIGPFFVDGYGVIKVDYYSEDWSGNVEEIQTADFRIVTARELLQDAQIRLGELESTNPIKQALKQLEQALNDKYWQDNNNLSDKGGKNVSAHLKNAIRQLEDEEDLSDIRGDIELALEILGMYNEEDDNSSSGGTSSVGGSGTLICILEGNCGPYKPHSKKKNKVEVLGLESVYTDDINNLYGLEKDLVEMISLVEAEEIYAYYEAVELSQENQIIFDKLIDGRELSEEDRSRIAYFIQLGTKTTKRLGAGERAGVLGSFVAAFGILPESVLDWQDVIKIANGRWPGKINAKAKTNALEKFTKVYTRGVDENNQYDDAAITIMAYGLRPANRNLDSEKFAIKIFKNIFKYNPESSTDWDIIRAIAYSGCER